MAETKEMRRNWITEGVADCRKIDKILKGRERRAEIGCIIGRIQSAGEKGKPFLANEEKLADAINSALDVADKAEKESNGEMTASPESRAMATICEKLGIDIESLD